MKGRREEDAKSDVERTVEQVRFPRDGAGMRACSLAVLSWIVFVFGGTGSAADGGSEEPCKVHG